MNFAFPNAAKIDWRPRVMTEQEKKEKRARELVAELRLYHHNESADMLEEMMEAARVLEHALGAALKTANALEEQLLKERFGP